MNKKNKLRIILVSFFSVVFSALLTLSFVFSIKTPSKIEISNEEEFMNINNDLNGYYSLKNNIVLTEFDNSFLPLEAFLFTILFNIIECPHPI